MITKRINTYNFEFKETCGACPEQYDVLLEGNQVGYVRLRWGGLRCEYPDCGGETVFYKDFDDGMQGCFDGYDQRNFYLEEIAKALYNKIYSTDSSES